MGLLLDSFSKLHGPVDFVVARAIDMTLPTIEIGRNLFSMCVAVKRRLAYSAF